MPPDDEPGAEALRDLFRNAAGLVEDTMNAIYREWTALVERIVDLLRRVEDELNEDSIWATICEWWTEKIVDAVRRVHELIDEIEPKVGKVLKVVEEAVVGASPILTLFETALAYTDKISTPVSELSGVMTATGDIDLWRGPAKISYEKRVVDQKSAVDVVAEQIQDSSHWLAELGATNTAYMVELGRKSAELVGELVVVVVDSTETAAGAVTQIVVSLAHLSEFLGAVVENILTYGLDLAQHMADVIVRINALNSSIHDSKGLDHGRWPAAAQI